MMLFFIGIIEMLIAAVWTKMVADSKVAASGFVTMVNILIWFYVLQTIVEDINNWHLALLYALGCAIGTSGSTYFFHTMEKRGKKLPKGLALDGNQND